MAKVNDREISYVMISVQIVLDDSDLTAPSKTPTSARRDEPQPSVRSEPSEQKPNSLRPSRESTSPTKVRINHLLGARRMMWSNLNLCNFIENSYP